MDMDMLEDTLATEKRAAAEAAPENGSLFVVAAAAAVYGFETGSSACDALVGAMRSTQDLVQPNDMFEVDDNAQCRLHLSYPLPFLLYHHTNSHCNKQLIKYHSYSDHKHQYAQIRSAQLACECEYVSVCVCMCVCACL